MLPEATTTELTKVHHPEGLEENREIAQRGGGVAGAARRAIEAESGRPVVTSQAAIDFTKVVSGVIEANGKEKPTQSIQESDGDGQKDS